MSIYSKEHEEFLKKKKKEKYLVILFQFLILIIFIATWQILANLKIINTFLFSSPENIINTTIKLFKDKLLTHIGVTFYETIISFLLASILGLIVATILLWNKTYC